MKAFLLRAIEGLPLALFLLYMAAMDPRAPADWRAPYYASTALALIACYVLLREHAILNRIYLGIALYFVSGTLALVTQWPWLNAEYGRLEGTAMLLWVLATGAWFTLFDVRGYIGLDAPPPTVRRASWLLLAVTIAATSVSLLFVGNRVLSSFLPFIAVFVAHGLLKSKLARSLFRSPR
jgi:hypothetical protein